MNSVVRPDSGSAELFPKTRFACLPQVQETKSPNTWYGKLLESVHNFLRETKPQPGYYLPSHIPQAEYVNGGVALLDRFMPGVAWWELIDIESLNLDSGIYCILGQLSFVSGFQDWHWMFRAMLTDDSDHWDPAYYGFMDQVANFSLWRHLILIRRGEQSEI